MAGRKTLQDLTIKDNFLFGAVMMDEELCRELLELVLGFRIAKVTVSREKSFVYHPEYKGVRLDIIAADEKNTHYNVEMQVSRKSKPGKRSRYYHSQIDMDLLLSGHDYAEPPDAYVIFICDFDPFGRKKYRYTFDMACREDGEVSLEDGSHTVFLSTCGENEDEVPEELVKFLKYVKAELKESTGDFKDSFVKRIQDAVRNVKASREMEEQFMLLEELIREEREDARKQALAEGRELGLSEGRELGLSEGRELGLSEGRELGLSEGMAQERVAAILEVLAGLGDVPDDIREHLSDVKDLDTLKFYFRQALSARSMDEFRRAVSGRDVDRHDGSVR